MKAQRALEKKEAKENQANPYEEEIEACEHLIAFCRKEMIKQGLMDDPDANIMEV